ncbi:MAG: aromatic ring-hydroxylating dioxygenase subunit alpha, partial [Flavobacteriaceae bacterium]|nr:aromatic ring-hydroxylating dioxygenase subunit alpha [Flavobacteriaceae bacterium]
MNKDFKIKKNIREAETLPADFYRSEEVFEAIKEKIFLRTWQWIGDEGLLPFNEHVYPFIFLENYINEPLVLVRDKEQNLMCFSNVCTHRGNIVVLNPGKMSTMRCMYHGRRFNLDGSFKSMPEFEEAENFPRPCDDLREFPVRLMNPFIFVGLNPAFDLDDVIKIMVERIGFLPLHQFKEDKSRHKDYLVNCHWALYIDNYLEGFHIPFVHDDLNAVLDYSNYTTELHDYLSLQVGHA